MALRLHRISDDEWRRLAAARRAEDLGALPARATIGAIEVELRALDRDTTPGPPRLLAPSAPHAHLR